MLKSWEDVNWCVYRVYIQGWMGVGGWSAHVDVLALDEIEAEDLVKEYPAQAGLPEFEYVEASDIKQAWWVRTWFKKKSDPSWRFELRDVKEW